MLTYAHVCSRMLTYAKARAVCIVLTFVGMRLLTYAHVCSRMLTYADARAVCIVLTF
jgi:hypothetical protein